jgi:IS1 family transposase
MLDKRAGMLHIEGMKRLTISRRAEIIRCLVEGNSIRSTVRITGAAKNTVTKLLVDIGAACSVYQNKHLRNLPCRRIQVDEIWSFTYAKAKNVPTAKAAPVGAGDTWTWTAICADTKLVPCWLVGPRDGEYALAFIDDLRSRLTNRVQLTSDGLKAYLEAIEESFGDDIDYAMLVKLYGSDTDGPANSAQRKYSPGDCTGTREARITGNPDPKHISTSYAERNNLTLRMAMRRFTRLTNAFSKKLANHEAAVALHFMHYNFVRIHQTLRITPAMAAGVTDRLWSMEDIAALVEAAAPKPGPRGPYKKRYA